jgi:hypothetical protein
MLSALNLDLGNGASLKTRQQHATQAIPDGRSEASFERFCDKLSVVRRERLLIAHN